jgi:cobalt-zinc-cadmium efflux system protein
MSAHPHSNASDPAHSHGPSVEADTRMLALALGINVAFMAVEVAIGILADSLALLSDAAHMLTDAGAIALALVAARLAQRQAGGSMTFGLKRGEILSAQVNGMTMLILSGFIVYEGIRRLVSPPDVEAGLVLWVGVAGLGANLGAAWALARANRESLNVEGAFQHNLIDAIGSIGAAVAALVILTTGFERADPIASLIVAALMLHSAYGLLRASGRIFLEAAPEGMDPEAIAAALLGEPGVVEVHDLHLWEITSGFPALSAHVVVEQSADCHEIRFHLAEQLRSRFHVDHSTLQVEHEPRRLLEVEKPGR